MPGLNVLISDEARDILGDFQHKHKFSRVDNALDAMIKSFAEMVKEKGEVYGKE